MDLLKDKIKNGKIPKHWYMDLNTLNTIKNNKPTFSTNASFNSNFASKIDNLLLELENFIPDFSWFLVQQEIDTIHGIRHMLRVSFLSMLLISLDNKIPPEFFKLSAVTSSLHDLRRRNDLLDVGHAKRGARWFINNVPLIKEKYNIELTDEEVDEIYYAILFHDIPYKKISDDENYIKYNNLIDITKTADALDRYRLPRVEWWIKDKLISLVPSDDIKHVAYQLLVLSETHFLNGFNGINSVLKALESLKNLNL